MAALTVLGVTFPLWIFGMISLEYPVAALLPTPLKWLVQTERLEAASASESVVSAPVRCISNIPEEERPGCVE